MDELSQIRQKIDIVPFIAEYLPLKKAGRNFKINCPFHNEKTPSFVVSPERQIFHCFGCGVGGDLFTFLMKYENLEFPEALRILAQRAGVELKRRAIDNQLSKTKEKLYEINHLTSEFYHYLLTNHHTGAKAMGYLKKRGINEGSIKTFKLGFVPNLWDSLIRFLVNKKKYATADLLAAGVVIKTERERYVDKFRNRIMFPLTDHRGNIVGFSGRILIDATQAKYINTPETLVYHKGDLFYGLDKAKEAIKNENRAILVEGEFDVIQAFQNGIKNVVAIKGTALTQNQANLIGRFTQNVNLCLDKDSAGDLANKRGIEILEDANLQVSIVRLPIGKDPDDSLRKNPTLFRRAIKNPVPIYDFIIELALLRWSAKEASGKKNISTEVVPFLAKITNEIVKNHYARKLAAELAVSEEAVLQEIAKIEKKETIVTGSDVKKGKKDREEVLAEYILALVIQGQRPKVFLPAIGELLKNNLFTSPLYPKIFQHLANFLAQGKFSIKKFIAFVPNQLVPTIDRSFLLALPDGLSEEKYQAEFDKAIRELKTLLVRRSMREVAGEIKLAEIEKDEKKLGMLKENFEKLTNELAFTLDHPLS